MVYQLNIGEQAFTVDVGAEADGRLRVVVNGTPYEVTISPDSAATVARPAAAAPARPAVPSGGPAPPADARPTAVAADGAVVAPIPGLIVAIPVQVGDEVLAGQTVAVMEAMKMENNLVSQRNGVVLEIRVQKGAEVATGDVILRIG